MTYAVCHLEKDHICSINTQHDNVNEYWVYLMWDMTWLYSNLEQEAQSIRAPTEGINCLYCIMITGSIIELLWLFMSCFVLLFWSTALMAYWTCQFTFSWVCESPLCCERSYCHEQLTAAKVVNRLNTVSVVCKDLFSHQHKHSIQRRDSWYWMELRTQKADASVGLLPTCAGDQGPGLCTWTKREKCLLFRCEFQMGGKL